MKAALWKLLFGRWRGVRPEREPGYSLLLPVPADLPFLVKLGLDVCARQDANHRNEILVVPDDDVGPAFGAVLRSACAEHPDLSVREVRLGRLARAITRRGNGHLNHFLQIIHGIAAARSTHVLLHDADAFLYDEQFLLRIYQQCVAGGYHAFGVQPVWDDWYRDNGHAHVVATWELMVERDWALGFRPFEHRGHTASIGDQRHVFDTMLLPQCRTPSHKIGRLDQPAGFVHFNYVVCTYRAFLRATDSVEDDRFRLLLIRLLSDAVGVASGMDGCRVPRYEELCRGLDDASAPVHYVSPTTAANYPEFRERLDELLNVDVLGASSVESVRQRLRPFDERFGWVAPAQPTALAGS